MDLLVDEGQVPDAGQHFPEQDDRSHLCRGEEQRQEHDHDHGKAESRCAADDTRQKNGGEDIGEQKRGEAGHKASSDGAGTDARPRKRPAGAGHRGSA